jgi:hypothetical protein
VHRLLTERDAASAVRRRSTSPSNRCVTL